MQPEQQRSQKKQSTGNRVSSVLCLTASYFFLPLGQSGFGGILLNVLREMLLELFLMQTHLCKSCQFVYRKHTALFDLVLLLRGIWLISSWRGHFLLRPFPIYHGIFLSMWRRISLESWILHQVVGYLWGLVSVYKSAACWIHLALFVCIGLQGWLLPIG